MTASPDNQKTERPAITVRWKRFALLGAVLLLVALVWALYPTDKTPKGAYYRVVTAVNSGRLEAIFPYIETRAQHAAFTIRGYQKKSYDLVSATYPEPVRTQELSRLEALARAEPGPGVFAVYANQYGWAAQLRRDLSGVSRVEVSGERATVQTAKGTRYPFRRRENGIWGLTLFTATLVSDAEKAARDFSVIEQAAKDYQRAASKTAP